MFVGRFGNRVTKDFGDGTIYGHLRLIRNFSFAIIREVGRKQHALDLGAMGTTFKVSLLCHGNGTYTGTTTTSQGSGGVHVQGLLRGFGTSYTLTHSGVKVIGQIGGTVTFFITGLGHFVVDIIGRTLGRTGLHARTLYNLRLESEHTHQRTGGTFCTTFYNNGHGTLNVITHEHNSGTIHLFLVHGLTSFGVETSSFGQTNGLRVFYFGVGVYTLSSVQNVGRVHFSSGFFGGTQYFVGSIGHGRVLALPFLLCVLGRFGAGRDFYRSRDTRGATLPDQVCSFTSQIGDA